MTPVPELEAVRAAAQPAPGHTLPLGARVREFEVIRLIGESRTSLVYLAWDHTLQREVALKEYMPASMVGRVRGSTEVVVAAERHADVVRAGLKGFLHEARLLSGLDHPALVKVNRFWGENGTAYMAMPRYEGPTLEKVLADLGRVPAEAELRSWLKPILNAVTLLHECAVWHQNIGPDEIVVTQAGPVLLGLATAAHTIEAIRHTPAAALKPGYAAIEQYGSEAGSTRGPWTDLYALGAVMYAAITGTAPVPAADRLAQDRLRPLSIVAAGLYSPAFLAAIDAAMAVQPKRRPADHAEFRALMGDIDAPAAVLPVLRPDLMQEPFAPAPPMERVLVPVRTPAANEARPRPAKKAANDESAPPEAAPRGPAPAAPPAVERQKIATPAIATPALAPPALTPAPITPATAAEPLRPAWMKSATAGAMGNRALYGIVAGCFALVGVAALVMQFAGGLSPQSAPAAASSAMQGAPAAAPAPVTRPAATVAAPTHASTTAATASMAARTPPAPVVVAPRTPSPAAAVAAVTALPTPPPPAPAQVQAIPAPIERQTRCTEILQKASLEKITAAETEFFKRECK